MFLQRPFGPADFLLSQLFGHPVTISWLTEAPWTFIAIVIADTWQWTPFMFVILLAGLASISPHLYEAAELDGVSPFQAFRFVTLLTDTFAANLRRRRSASLPHSVQRPKDLQRG